MAQSPEQNAANTEIIRYDLGWNAINAMLREGRSLSGHERNCCFLNTRGDRFADVSAAAGLDLIDDGRVLALADWDYDGDIDFWIANRSGPQVRFLQNRLPSDRHFVAFRLEGVQSNRDAIGARVAVTCEMGGQRLTQAKTLRAGEGYLAQNSKWLHFGLGEAQTIAHLVVDWPNGAHQEFGPMAADVWYQLREGDAECVVWQPPRLAPLGAEPLVEPTNSEQARIVLLQPLPVPPIRFTATGNKSLDLSRRSGRPRLVNLWATWCKPCLEELTEWQRHAGELEECGIEILAINVDEEAEDRHQKVAAVLDALQLPFSTGSGDEELVTQFDILQRSLLSRQRPLPIPSSFLLDAAGRLRIVYKGPVAIETLLSDSELMTAERDSILNAAIPFGGKWLDSPGGSTPLHLALKYVEAGLNRAARDYLESLVEQRDRHPEFVTSSVFNLYGALLLDDEQLEAALEAFQASLQLDPQNRQAHIELGTLLARLGRGTDAVPHFDAVLRATPNDPELHYRRGVALLQSGKLSEAKSALTKSVELRANVGVYMQLGNLSIQLRDPREAIKNYETAIRLKPTLVHSANNLAWLLATVDDEDLRNGARALEIARKIVSSRENVDASALDTLAAALAETEDYTAAVRTAEQAVELAKQQGDAGLVSRILSRLKRYQAGLPHRETL